MKRKFKRVACRLLVERIHEPRRFLQIVSGPRQSGKTTLVRQAVEEAGLPFYYASAEEPALRGSGWIEQHWEAARTQTNGSKRADAVLMLDEIQKISGWSETVKRLWDEDTASGVNLKVVLLGSSPLLVQRGLTESLTGRFETISVTRWSFKEMREAFGWPAEQYI